MDFLKVFIKAAASLFMALFALGGIFVIILFWQIDPFQWKVPSDQKLIGLFQKHRVEFEKLERMADQDTRRGLAFEVDPANARLVKTISPTRRKEYDTLLSRIGSDLQLTMDDSYGREVRFIAAQGGAGPIGDDWLKGIEHLEKYSEQEGKVVPSLDGAYRLPEGDYLRPIESGWYLVYSVY